MNCGVTKLQSGGWFPVSCKWGHDLFNVSSSSLEPLPFINRCACLHGAGLMSWNNELLWFPPSPSSLSQKLGQSNTLSSMSKHSIMLSQSEILLRKCRHMLAWIYSSWEWFWFPQGLKKYLPLELFQRHFLPFYLNLISSSHAIWQNFSILCVSLPLSDMYRTAWYIDPINSKKSKILVSLICSQTYWTPLGAQL